MLDFSNKMHQYNTLASHHTSQKANCSPVAQLEKWGLPAAELHCKTRNLQNTKSCASLDFLNLFMNTSVQIFHTPKKISWTF